MALTDFYALQKLRATPLQALVDEFDSLETPQIVSSASASAAIGTTNTAVLTLTSCVFRAGRAYMVENIGGVLSDAAGRFADFSLFKTSTAGTQWGAFYRTTCQGAFQVNGYGKIYLQRSAGTDLTADLVLTLQANAGTVTHDAAAARPRALVVTDVGPATGYTYAFDVT